MGDLLSNATRGIVAEYLVMQGLGCVDKPRNEWSSWDLEMPSGLKIEVKSSGYLQSWVQTRRSPIKFGIGRRQPLKEGGATTESFRLRSADVYVLCVFEEEDKAKADPLNTDQWSFLVVPTTWFEEHMPDAKTVGLTVLLRKGLSLVRFGDLKTELERFFPGHCEMTLE